MLQLYKNIRKRRIELNMSQQELADKLGYKSRSAINKIELGINDITQSKIIAFAKALDTTPAYLMGWEEEQARSSESDKLIKDIVETLKGCTTEQVEQIYNFVKVMCKKD